MRPTVAELIGETPETMLIIGRIMALDYERKVKGTPSRDTYRVKRHKALIKLREVRAEHQ